MTDAQLDTERSPAADSVSDPIQIDLYCLECGYNLRGLSGDPVRCPECAFLNPIGDVEIPAPIISKQLRRMESAPAASVLVLLFMIYAYVVIGAMCLGGFWEDAQCPFIAACVATVVWIGIVSHFRSSCLGRPGWLAALLRYQFVGVVLACLVLGVFLIATESMIDHRWRWNEYLGDDWPCLALPLMFIAVVAAIVWGLRPVHRWLKAPIEQLQRQVAVKLARDRIRQELRQKRRWGKST
jgi:hypothetical protein